MTDLINMRLDSQLVRGQDGTVRASSRAVAETFGKQHKNVLADIKALDCSADFNRLNFQPVDYVDTKGERRPEVLLTRDGLTFLVMGYRGAKAAAVKQAWIAAFNQYEARARAVPSVDMQVVSLIAETGKLMQSLNARQTQLETKQEETSKETLVARAEAKAAAILAQDALHAAKVAVKKVKGAKRKYPVVDMKRTLEALKPLAEASEVSPPRLPPFAAAAVNTCYEKLVLNGGWLERHEYIHIIRIAEGAHCKILAPQVVDEASPISQATGAGASTTETLQ